MTTLKITHNAGFFSCFSKRLEGIVWFFNTHKRLPDVVDSTEQFSLLKVYPSDNLIPMYFKERDINIEYVRPIAFHNDDQFSDYKTLDFEGLSPFIEKYFTPSDAVVEMVSMYEKKYAIDYANTCVVLYRGNDKSTETNVAGHEVFIEKANAFKQKNLSTTFLVQTDEAEFLAAFMDKFPDSITFKETPSMNRMKSAVHDELPRHTRAEHGRAFFAAIIVLARCKHVIVPSGNVSLWLVLYRGNCDNVSQDFNNSWDYRSYSPYALWQKYKRYIKGTLNALNIKRHSYWSVTESE